MRRMFWVQIIGGGKLTVEWKHVVVFEEGKTRVSFPLGSLILNECSNWIEICWWQTTDRTFGPQRIIRWKLMIFETILQLILGRSWIYWMRIPILLRWILINSIASCLFSCINTSSFTCLVYVGAEFFCAEFVHCGKVLESGDDFTIFLMWG